MVRRGSTVRVRQRASRDPAWFLELPDRRAWGSAGRNARYGSGRESRVAPATSNPRTNLRLESLGQNRNGLTILALVDTFFL
jgi:hypothetical protein